MSRCFPYPPSGYCRNGATYEALIESIKLQKETNKTKTERKKEKKARKEKKEKCQKEKRNNEDELKLQKAADHKVLQKAADHTEATKKTKTFTEPFEKSDLTEEYGQPIRQQPSYSSDSTQNSNKRKRDESSLLHDSSISHGKGKTIKIRLLKKHKETDPSNFCADAISNLHPSKSSFFYRKNGVPAKTNLIPEESKIGDSNRLQFHRIQAVSSSVKPVHTFASLKSDVEMHEFARPQLPILRFERQVLPSICLENEIPSSSGSRHDEHELHSCSQQLLVPSHHGKQIHVSNMTSTSTAGKGTDPETASIKKQKEDQSKVGPTRFERKMLKKHSKYEKLMGTFFPPAFQANLTFDDDDDWLSGSKSSSSTVCKGDVEACRQLVAPWQPCARYLAEVDMHALPYTVPF